MWYTLRASAKVGDFKKIGCYVFFGGKMRLFLTLIIALSSSLGIAATDCSIMAESYVVDMDSTQPALYMGRTREGDLVFHVNAQLRGQKSIFEVVLKPTDCEYVSTRKL